MTKSAYVLIYHQLKDIYDLALQRVKTLKRLWVGVKHFVLRLGKENSNKMLRPIKVGYVKREKLIC